MGKILVLKRDHNVRITHTVESMQVHYPIRAVEQGEQGLWVYTGGDSEEFVETAEIVITDGERTYHSDDSGEDYRESEIELIDDPEDADDED